MAAPRLPDYTVSSAIRSMPIIGNRGKSNGNLGPDEAAIGLDLGTTGGRACLIYGKQAENISSSDNFCDPSRSDSDVNFGASVYPFQFDNEKPPTVRHDAEVLPLKFSFYVLQILELRLENPRSRYETDTKRDIPQVESFFRRYDATTEENKRQAILRIERALMHLLERIEEQARIKAEMQQLKITRLIATIPSTWTQWMQAYYTVRLATVWNMDTGDVDIIYESEAIANLLLNRCPNLLLAGNGPKILVLIDLGGHTLLHYSDPTRFSVYGMENDICIHGGLELHASLVAARILQDFDSGKLKVAEDKEREVFTLLMDSYRSKRMTVQGQEFFIHAVPTSGSYFEVKFEQEEASRLHQECFGKAMEAVSRHFDQVTAYGEPRSTEVVLTGGSFRNIHLITAVKEKIKDHGFFHRDSKQFSLDAKQAGNVAVGAACAFLNAQTVKEFMQMAAFAVQQSSDGSKPDVVIWDNGISRTARVYLPGPQRAERYITCCPVPEACNATSIDGGSAYKVTALPRSLTMGYYHIRMEYLDPSQSPTGSDLVRIWFTKESMRETNVGINYEFPIYYDCGPRVCFDDIDKRPNRRRNRRRACAQANEGNCRDFLEVHLPLPELEARLQTELKERTSSREDKMVAIAETSEFIEHIPSSNTFEKVMEVSGAPRKLKQIRRRKRQASSPLSAPSVHSIGKEHNASALVDGQRTQGSHPSSSSSLMVETVPGKDCAEQQQGEQSSAVNEPNDDVQEVAWLRKSHATFIT
ncbi:hypothetical protein PWT90_10213 [Aphanocladium album]|nr:hypothetical protein PWT90_10213 [Aphanocladium album]